MGCKMNCSSTQLVSIAVAVMLISCGTETKIIAHETDHSRACRLYGLALRDADRRCGLECPDGCELWGSEFCFDFTEPEDVELIDSCRLFAELIPCDAYEDWYWLPVCEGG